MRMVLRWLIVVKDAGTMSSIQLLVQDVWLRNVSDFKPCHFSDGLDSPFPVGVQRLFCVHSYSMVRKPEKSHKDVAYPVFLVPLLLRPL